jgi:gliding motility-associated-like protein
LSTKVSTKSIIFCRFDYGTLLFCELQQTPKGVPKERWTHPNNQLIITDRSSRIVYQKSGYANDWNGLFNSAPLPTDTYYYILTFDLPSGKKVSKKGFITIMN